VKLNYYSLRFCPHYTHTHMLQASADLVLYILQYLSHTQSACPNIFLISLVLCKTTRCHVQLHLPEFIEVDQFGFCEFMNVSFLYRQSCGQLTGTVLEQKKSSSGEAVCICTFIHVQLTNNLGSNLK